MGVVLILIIKDWLIRAEFTQRNSPVGNIGESEGGCPQRMGLSEASGALHG